MVAETYGASGTEAMDLFSKLPCYDFGKFIVLYDIYGWLNLHLVSSNANAILTRCLQPDFAWAPKVPYCCDVYITFNNDNVCAFAFILICICRNYKY